MQQEDRGMVSGGIKPSEESQAIAGGKRDLPELQMRFTDPGDATIRVREIKGISKRDADRPERQRCDPTGGMPQGIAAQPNKDKERYPHQRRIAIITPAFVIPAYSFAP